MKIRRCRITAFMLSAALLLGGCGSTAASGGNSGNNSAGTDVTKDKTKDAADKTKKAPEIEGLTYESTMDLTYATEFDVYYYKDGYKLIDVHEDKQYLIVPKGKEEPENLADDLLFLHELSPQMAGIGPFIPHHQTPFSAFPTGTLRQTLLMVALTRLVLPNALLPATTALGTIAPDGRERGVLAGANGVMPNLSPVGVRKQYALYDNKICTGDEAAECRACLQNRMRSIGYELAVDRGDFVPE